jgi:hypothetical protein
VNNDIYAPIASYLKNNIILDPDYKANYNEEERILIELLFTSLDANIDPTSIITQVGSKTIDDILGININYLSMFDPSNVNVSNSDNSPKDIQLNKKQIFCSSFSNHKDLSEAYEYANPVSQYTCSHDEIIGHLCVVPNRQDRCPFYSPDFYHFATYSLVEDSQVYFNIYRHRATTGLTVYTIYDNDNNLIHNLSYDASTVYDHAKKDFNSELESIVLQNYSFINKNAKFNYIYHNQKSEVIQDNSNSYIATLVSIS